MASRPNDELLYTVFQKFLHSCIQQDRSLLWPERGAWTKERVGDVKKRMVDSPIRGDTLSFEEKLTKQMEGASSEHWAIICDLFYVYFLPSSFITLEKKQKSIQWAAQHGHLEPPPSNSKVWEALKSGFTPTGQKYHLKYLQLWLILLFAFHVKMEQDREVLVSNAEAMQNLLDEILYSIPKGTHRAYDMRHAMLYLAFPDLYEGIISTRDKKKILDTYRQRVQDPLPCDLDQAILKIRQTLSEQYDTPDRPFDFCQQLKHEAKKRAATLEDQGQPHRSRDSSRGRH